MIAKLGKIDRRPGFQNDLYPLRPCTHFDMSASVDAYRHRTPTLIGVFPCEGVHFFSVETDEILFLRDSGIGEPYRINRLIPKKSLQFAVIPSIPDLRPIRENVSNAMISPEFPDIS
jgi:hypothetical protein